jgi:hypothetical protein
MSKKTTVSFYDACLPDYFSGHHKPVLQYPVDGSTTRKQLYNGLLSELAEGVINYEIDENKLDYDAIRQAIKDCIFWNDNCNDQDIIFPTLETLPEDSELESSDMCHALFVIDWEEMEDE